MKFSMCLPEVQEHIKTNIPDLRSVILCGIEAQACVQATVLDLLEKDYDVHIIADAVSSRSMVDRMLSLQRMKDMGAFITTSESMLLQLCQGSDHPEFRKIQKIITEPAPDSGLVGFNNAQTNTL